MPVGSRWKSTPAYRSEKRRRSTTASSGGSRFDHALLLVTAVVDTLGYLLALRVTAATA